MKITATVAALLAGTTIAGSALACETTLRSSDTRPDGYPARRRTRSSRPASA